MEEVMFLSYTVDFLDLSWGWLNDPEIKALTKTPDMTREGQRKWFDGLEFKTDYKVWGIAYEGEKIGVMGLKNIKGNVEAEYFGYIGDKAFWNKGLSKNLLSFAVRQARELGLKSLWLRVVKSNPRAIRAYEKFGFQRFDVSEDELYMRLNISIITEDFIKTI